jgi:hypothetical protein
MRKTVLTFGLIAGAILSLMLVASFAVFDVIGFDRAAIVGYTSMVLAFLLIFFGVRSYRDDVAGGTIGFGRAFVVGALIAVVASACYAATWQVVYRTMDPGFTERHQAHVLEKERARGASAEALAAKQAELERFAELYRNPLFNIAITFIEPLPVGLLIALVTAAVVRRRRGAAATERSVVPG